MSKTNPPDVLDLLTDFPHAAGAFAEMKRYVKLVSQFEDFPTAQTTTRLKAELTRTTDPVRQSELQYELKVAERDTTSSVPRIVWGSILVAIYATFETGIKAALMHWGSQVPGASVFECKGTGLLKVAGAYAASEIEVELFPNSSVKAVVLELKLLRDSFAHSAGRVPSRRKEFHSLIENSRARGYPILIEEESWIAPPRAVAFYLLQTEQSYKLFSEAVMEKYIARMAPRTEA